MRRQQDFVVVFAMVLLFPHPCSPATLHPTPMPSEFPTPLPSSSPSKLPSQIPLPQPTWAPVHPPSPAPTETRPDNPRGGSLRDSLVYLTSITHGVKTLSSEDVELMASQGFQSSAERVDDTPMDRIKLKFPFNYGGNRYRHAYVNANGKEAKP